MTPCQSIKGQENKSATEQAPRHPPQPLEEALNTLSGKQPTDNGRVVTGKSKPAKDGSGGRFYFNFTGFPFPLGPLFARQTVRCEVEPGTIWCFEQEHSLAGINVATTIRMTVVKLKNGDLLVYAPVAPTRECLDLLKELGGPVKHIVLTTHAYEHKVFVAPFQRKFPDARVYVPPNLWSFPLNLPLPLLGIFNAQVMTSDDMELPWSDELSHKVFCSKIGLAPYIEVALHHRKAKVLMVTDAVVYIPEDPPEVVNRDRLQRAGEDNLFVRLLYAKDKPQIPKTLDEQEKLGWKRMALLISYFSPEHLRDPVTFPIIEGRLIVMPVVQTLCFAKCPGATRKWIDAITQEWDFNRVISAHFSAPVDAGPADVRDAFRFAYDMAELGTDKQTQRERSADQGGKGPISWPQNIKETSHGVNFPQQDLKGLNYIDSFLKFCGIVFREPRN
ncbi:hypothetical protein ABBQ32_011259 [Trebouxia sp. C0010 RCD-2024]